MRVSFTCSVSSACCTLFVKLKYARAFLKRLIRFITPVSFSTPLSVDSSSLFAKEKIQIVGFRVLVRHQTKKREGPLRIGTEIKSTKLHHWSVMGVDITADLVRKRATPCLPVEVKAFPLGTACKSP